MAKNKDDYQPKRMCEYRADKNGVYTECGYRVAFNKFMKYCPYCGKPICRFFMKIGGRIYVYKE